MTEVFIEVLIVHAFGLSERTKSIQDRLHTALGTP